MGIDNLEVLKDEPPCLMCNGMGQLYDGPHIRWVACPLCKKETK